MHVKAVILTVIYKAQCIRVPPTAAAPKDKQQNSRTCPTS